jgi:hypothetical protein
MTNREMLELRAALRSLCTPAYKLSSGVRLTLARNLKRLEDAAAVYDQARRDKAQECGVADQDLAKVPKENADAWRKGLDELLKADAEVTMTRIAFADVKPDENQIPPATLADSADVFKDFEDPDELARERAAKEKAGGAAAK